jgi:sec-independent protein translocase protein TatC
VTLQDDERPDLMVKPFWHHLDDLRRTLLRSVVAQLIGMGLAGGFAPRLFEILKRPLGKVVPDPDSFLRSLDVTGGMSVAMQTLLWGGLLLAAPFIVVFICQFVFPALTRRERRIALFGLGTAVVLFTLGVLLCYFTALAPALQIMLWFNEWMGIKVEYFTVTSYVGFVLKLMLGFGLTFELPMVLVILGRMGLVSSDFLRDKRRHAVIVILVLAAVITPTQDPFSQLLLALPLVVFYELCIWIIRAGEKKGSGSGSSIDHPA